MRDYASFRPHVSRCESSDETGALPERGVPVGAPVTDARQSGSLSVEENVKATFLQPKKGSRGMSLCMHDGLQEVHLARSVTLG